MTLLGDRAQKHRLMHECVAGPSTANKSPNSQSGEQLWGSWKTREQGCFPLVVKAQRNQCCLTNSARKHISTCMSSLHPTPPTRTRALVRRSHKQPHLGVKSLRHLLDFSATLETPPLTHQPPHWQRAIHWTSRESLSVGFIFRSYQSGWKDGS